MRRITSHIAVAWVMMARQGNARQIGAVAVGALRSSCWACVESGRVSDGANKSCSEARTVARHPANVSNIYTPTFAIPSP